jgi:hypothetical protein
MTDTIKVNVAELEETCTAVRIDFEQGLRPGITDASRKVQLGVRFGQMSPSGEADAARRALLAALQRYRENSERHLSTADHLIRTLDAILSNYAHADTAARLDVQTVQTMLEIALPQPSLAPELSS